MKLIRVGAAVVNQTPLDWVGNEANVVEVLNEARSQGVTICCLPELCLTGYGCEDAFQSHDVRERAWRMLKAILPATAGMIVSVGLPVAYKNALFNVAAVLVDGALVGLSAKRFLAGDGIYYEPRWFRPWPDDVRGELRTGHEDPGVPIGDLHFEIGGVKLGFEICEDAWVAGRPGAALARQGVDILLNPSASHFAFGKRDIRRRFVLEGSRAFGVSYVYANLLGNDSGRAIYDGGALVASNGRLIAVGPRFSFADWQLTTAVIDVEATRLSRARTGSFMPELREDPGLVRVDFAYPELLPEGALSGTPKEEPWELGEFVKEEEFARAEALALFDYLRKSRSRGFVVSLSGGADSAAVSCLVALMAASALGELGHAALCQRLPYLRIPEDPKALVSSLLTCVYQPTENSSETTRSAARSVAEAISAEYLELDVGALVAGYVGLVSKAIGRELTWETDDVPLQNIQARVRSPGVWMLANLKGALLLATSNRSEAAVGYATMDGDTSGGLSPIAGIDKAFLRRWLVWLETRGPEGLFAIPALCSINVQAPTAELRPKSASQTDEADLMPYEILDAIERAAIRDKRSPEECLALLRAHYPERSEAELTTFVERFFRLFCRNQWKRERYAPSFHLDDENLDPKTWCRFPILSGGFEAELSELRGVPKAPRR